MLIILVIIAKWLLHNIKCAVLSFTYFIIERWKLVLFRWFCDFAYLWHIDQFIRCTNVSSRELLQIPDGVYCAMRSSDARVGIFGFSLPWENKLWIWFGYAVKWGRGPLILKGTTRGHSDSIVIGSIEGFQVRSDLSFDRGREPGSLGHSQVLLDFALNGARWILAVRNSERTRREILLDYIKIITRKSLGMLY